MENHDTPSFSHLTIFAARNFLKHRRVPLRKALVMWDKRLPKKCRDIPSYALSFLTHEISETLKGSSRKSFATLREDNFNGKSWQPLSLTPNNFRYKKFSETKKGSSTKSFGFLRRNGFDGNSWGPTTLSPLNFSIPEFLWNTQRLLNEKFWFCETKQFWRKIVICAHLSALTFLDATKFLKHRRLHLDIF